MRRYLQDTPGEVQALFDDMLINVTGFFRDPELLRRVETEGVSRHCREEACRGADSGVGAGVFHGRGGVLDRHRAAGVSRRAGAAIARPDFRHRCEQRGAGVGEEGQYSPNIAADVSPERLARFFSGDETGYRISKSIRDVCVFANQNVTKDPPFSHIDLLSCRNLLIYLGPVLQERIIPAFHFALKPRAFWCWAPRRRWRILGPVSGRRQEIQSLYQEAGRAGLPIGSDLPTSPRGRHGRQRRLPRWLERAPIWSDRPTGSCWPGMGLPAWSSTSRMKILQFRGQVGRYLEPASGEATFRLSKMACPRFSFELQAAVLKVEEGGRADAAGRV